MSIAKQVIIENLSNISDYIQDEFEVMENLYKLLRYRKSKESTTQNGGNTTDDVKSVLRGCFS